MPSAECRRWQLWSQAGIEGFAGASGCTTRRDDTTPRHPDLVGRDFTAAAPNQLWVTDLTYVPTWAGMAYVCLIIDVYSRMIVGWRVTADMRADCDFSIRLSYPPSGTRRYKAVRLPCRWVCRVQNPEVCLSLPRRSAWK
jgi:hypothetical protein